jgi:diaminopimelate decarboxylase
VAFLKSRGERVMYEWNQLGGRARSIASSPCFVFSERMVRRSLSTLRCAESTLPLRHWLSFKTQPVARLVRSALNWGLGIEVSSEFEFAAALASDVPPSAILVNGVGKHHWLPRYAIARLNVHFDSLAEVSALAGMAKKLAWRVGVRCAVPHSIDGFAPTWDQFGMVQEEVPKAVATLRGAGVPVRGLHFHLHTNVAHASEYRRAIEHVHQISTFAHLEPEYLDAGGGLPIPKEQPHDTRSEATFDFEEFRDVLGSIPHMFPTVQEVWLENGRFLTGAAGALVVTVLDKKERGGQTYLICDGGRVNHARLAATEVHDIVVEPNRGGPKTETIVCGPTCGAVDRLGSWYLPTSVAPGDMIMWLSAGAYHIPLETRFSFGLAPVVWFDECDEPEVIRERETPAEWWKPWAPSERVASAVPR